MDVLILMAVGLLAPVLLFRWYLRRWGGMADIDESARVASSWVRNEYRHQNEPRPSDPPTDR